MSYILDALRKADAERERDPSRGIHAQPAALQGRAGMARGAAWPWVAGGAVLLAVMAVMLWPPGAATAPAAVPATPVVAVQAPPPPAPVSPAPANEVQPAPPAMPTAPSMAPPVAAAPVPAVPRAALVAPPAATQAPGPAAGLPQPTPSAPAAPSADRVVAFSELPPDVQRDLPKIAINGGVHSENAAQRMLIVGGQVMAEGAELAPGLVLEQIRPKAAVLRFRGLRYSLPY